MKTYLEKAYRPAVVILLALLVVSQFVSMPSKNCQLAVKKAELLQQQTEKDMTKFLVDYRDVVYNKADNINQQMFLAQEQTFFVLHKTMLVQSVIMETLAECNK